MNAITKQILQEAAALEGTVELDKAEHSDIINLIKAYNEAKAAFDAAEQAKDLLREKLDAAFAGVGISGKGKVMLSGKPLLSRSIGRKVTLDKAVVYRLAPKAAKKAEKVTEYFMYRRPKGA